MAAEREEEAATAGEPGVREVDQELLTLFREYLRYDSGELYWIKRPGPSAKMGDPVGCYDSYGYLVFKLKGMMYKVHRVIFFMHHEYWPETVDHISRDKADNAIDNLRDASWMENRWNTDDDNVSFEGSRDLPRPYRVLIRRNYQIVHDSRHATYEEALAVAKSKKNSLGEVNV